MVFILRQVPDYIKTIGELLSTYTQTLNESLCRHPLKWKYQICENLLSVKCSFNYEIFVRVIFSIQDAILFVEKPTLLMFRTIGKFFAPSDAQGHGTFSISMLQMTAGLALQLGTLRISRNVWRRSLRALMKWDHVVQRSLVLHVAEVRKLHFPKLHFPNFINVSHVYSREQPFSYISNLINNNCWHLTTNLFLFWYLPFKQYQALFQWHM